LLRDHVPRVDPADREGVEDETGGEEEGRHPAFVARVVQPEALDRAQ